MIVVDCCDQRNILLLEMLGSGGKNAMSLDEYTVRGYRENIDLALGVGSKLTQAQIELVGEESRVFYFVYDESLDELDCQKVRLLSLPSFVTANSYLTAEGALGLIITHTDRALCDMDVGVIGWGYLAKECAKVIGALSNSLTVMARSNSARQEATSQGYMAVDIGDELGEFDVIVNTVPAKIFGQPKLKEGAFVIELASKIYPFDYEKLGKENVDYLIAKAVPSKLSSKSAARILMETIISYKE